MRDALRDAALLVRHCSLMTGWVVASGFRTGRWAFVLLLVLCSLALLVGSFVQVTVPTATYVLF